MTRPSLRTVRRMVQIGVALAMGSVPFLNRRSIHLLSGNFLAFDLAGLPLADPLAVLQTGLASQAPALRAVGGATVAVALAFTLGPVFCSWACPFGFLSELVFSLRRRPGSNETRKPGRRGLGAKAGIVGTGLASAAFLAWPPLLNQLSMPGWYSRLFQLLALEDAILPALLLPASILLLELALGRRLWCRYACPQSILLALARRLNPAALRVEFEPGRCRCARGDEGCLRACSLGLEPRRTAGLAMECSNCGDCVGSCRDRGQALRLRLGRAPRSGKKH